MAHLKYETLVNYIDGQLSVRERGEADAHFAQSCGQCTRRLDLLRKVFRHAAQDQTVAPSASVLQQAIDIHLERGKPAQAVPWTRLIAALTFDSHLQPSSALTRGTARERQMLFASEQVEIDLQIKSGHQDHDLIGQVLAEKGPGEAAFVSLQGTTGQLLKATETDSMGQFAFRGISSGVYDLIFDLENQEVAVMGIEVKNG
jgi:hypothetical protein